VIDLVLVVLFIGVPSAIWLVTRSMAWTAIGLTFGFGIAGNAVQSLISLGVHWNVRGLQLLAVAVMCLVLVVGVAWGRRPGDLRTQALVVLLPAVLVGAFLVVMRLLAPGSPGPLTAVGYLINHPQAEDNAKWLHLAAQLADGRDITFNGYAGGPLLLLMSTMAALIAVLSQVLLGGVNEVAVAANTVVGTQFLLIAMAPLSLCLFAERRVSLRSGSRRLVSWPALWVTMFVLIVASSVVTSYGHLSLQFTLLVITIWATSFLLLGPGRSRLLATLAVVCAASVWIPFNVLGLVLLAGCFVWAIRSRNWLSLGACVVTALSVWDALISSTLFLLGIDSGSRAGEAGAGTAAGDAGSSVQSAAYAQVETAKSLFTAPGGVEQIQPLVAALTLASVVFCVWLVARVDSGRWRRFVPFAPIAILGTYLLVIDVADAVTTGGAPHYGGHKLAFAVTIMALVSTLPVSITGIDYSSLRVTPARWFAVGGVVFLLTLDTMLPRALSALSPMLWPSVDRSAPAYWSPAEVKPIASQPISSLPVACVFAPPQSATPGALPLGQQSYSCTRILLGLTGREGSVPVLTTWLVSDWLSNQSHWKDFYAPLKNSVGDLAPRSVLLMKPDGETAGVTTLGALLAQPPSS